MNRELTYCAEPGHQQYPLPPLPAGFHWRQHELERPAFTCDILNQLDRIQDT